LQWSATVPAQLISLIESAAPAIATALGGPLSGAAVQILARALGAPSDDLATVTQTAIDLHPEVRHAAAIRADAQLSQAVNSVAPVAQPAPGNQGSPVGDAVAKAFTSAGVTNPTWVTIGCMASTLLSGFLIQRGSVSADQIVQGIGVVTGLISFATAAFHSVASNRNTVAMMKAA
jgi:hypothetical protein